MSSNAENKMPWVNYVGFAILLVCYVGALFNVVRMKKTEMTQEIIRIAHWQLELGVRDALDEMVARFEKKKAAEGQKVKILQIPITEKAYSQYVTTQLIGETAPDMIEIGFFPNEYLGRYFYPLSQTIQQKNPYVEERLRELEGLPDDDEAKKDYLDAYHWLAERRWMDSFNDGLRGQYKPELFEYYGVGFSQFTVRMFYNKNLFREVLGHDRAPKTYAELIDVCNRIQAYSAKSGREVTPIASSQYQMFIFKWRYLNSMTADVVVDFDLNLDGWLGADEKLMAMLRGEWRPDNEQFESAMQVLQELSGYFPPGFMALGRMDSGFSFVQGNAAMITSGSWDAKSYVTKINSLPEDMRFEVGIFDFPVIGNDHPKYGEFYDGRVSEANTETGFAFGVTRFTKHFDLCIEFLQFCTAPENNAVLNEIAEWIPSIKGAKATPLLKAFEPNYVGYWSGGDFDAGERSKITEEQVFWPFISGDIDFNVYAGRLKEELPEALATDYGRQYRSLSEAIPNRRGIRSGFLAQYVFGEASQKEEAKIKLLRAWDSLAGYELGQQNMDALMAQTKEHIPKEVEESDFNNRFFEYLTREIGD